MGMWYHELVPCCQAGDRQQKEAGRAHVSLILQFKPTVWQSVNSSLAFKNVCVQMDPFSRPSEFLGTGPLLYLEVLYLFPTQRQEASRASS